MTTDTRTPWIGYFPDGLIIVDEVLLPAGGLGGFAFFGFFASRPCLFLDMSAPNGQPETLRQ